MTLKSMTGFGSSQNDWDDLHWNWELKSVNGKGLDIRLRLPQGFESLEKRAKALITKNISRGNIQASLTMNTNVRSAVTSVNEVALRNILEHIEKIESTIKTSPSTAAEILSLRGVLEMSETPMSDEQSLQLNQQLLASLDAAVADLIDNRAKEGAALAIVLAGQIDQIEQHTNNVKADPSRSSEAIRDRISQQVQTLLETSGDLDSARLHQESALLATKADLREELDRLDAHVVAARDLIAKTDPVGRKLEFLAQEFNRESNTLCSKSNAVSVTNEGLAMKVVVDQFREQILNVE